MLTASNTYPMQLTIDYPDRKLNRLTTFFRLFMVIPIAIILGLIAGTAFAWGRDGQSFQAATGGLVVLPTVLMILFRKKYPRWWFDWNLALTRFSTRVYAYSMLLRDEYPSTDEEQAVHIDIPYPNAKEELDRWLPLVKWIMAIPHYIVLLFLHIGLLVAVIIAWFAILFTGRYPKSLFDYAVGVLRWSLRVSVYAFLLTTDRYPPFRLGD
ncbi:MAG TPA: DUF4389 domain-containing protein [Desulfotomaculum sp.]|nr:DUF4389 domain-containing protein [Desulfotomaculum sp.]